MLFLHCFFFLSLFLVWIAPDSHQPVCIVEKRIRLTHEGRLDSKTIERTKKNDLQTKSAASVV